MDDKLKGDGKMIKELSKYSNVFFFEIVPDWIRKDARCIFHFRS